MPKSKRLQKVSLTKTKKKGLDLKQHVVEEIRSSVDKYERMFVFRIENMRNVKLQAVRESWKDSRFFIGKNRVMKVALGRSDADEYREGLHSVGRYLAGQCGLLFTDRSRKDVVRWFSSHQEEEFARTGNKVHETVVLDAGPLPQFAFSMEPHLRLQLGLPTKLQKGVVTLIKDFTVCSKDDTLTAEQARILKLLGHHTVQFEFKLLCAWEKCGGTLKELQEEVEESDVIKEDNVDENIDAR